jgi:ATP synthase F1 complex assembly factor 1
LQKQFEATQVAKPTFESRYQVKEDKLNDIMKLDLIENKSKEEIKEIWYEYHKQKDCISGVLTKEQFMKMFELGKKYNTFLLPLPRDHGYEFIMSQFYGTKIYMTPLLWYQVHKENAPECLTMIHYTELMDSKDIVLMKGEIDIKSINVQEAQCLANELQMYYSSDNPHRLELLKTFNEQPNNFKHMDLITNLETISFDSYPGDSLLAKK